MYDLLAVLAALGLLMYLTYRGISLLILAPAMALLAAVFMLGAIFGKLMDDSGCAKSIARSVSAWLGPERAILSVVLCCAVLTYGGVSAFVVAFAVFPIAAALFRGMEYP